MYLGWDGVPLTNVYHIIKHWETSNWEIIDLKYLFLYINKARVWGTWVFFFFFKTKFYWEICSSSGTFTVYWNFSWWCRYIYGDLWGDQYKGSSKWNMTHTSVSQSVIHRPPVPISPAFLVKNTEFWALPSVGFMEI